MNRKGYIFKICIWVLFVFPALSGYRAYADTHRFGVEVLCGYNGVVKSGGSIPLTVEIKNEGESFGGSVNLHPGSEAAYASDVVIGAGETKTVYFYIPEMENYSQIRVTINDSGGKEVYSKDNVVRAAAYSTPFIGVLSDDYGALSYLSNLFVRSRSYPGYPTVINLSKSMPDSEGGFLDMFDVIVLNDFHTDKLTRGQGELLKEWVGQGGTLLIGTGVNHQKTISGFINDYLGGTIGRVESATGSLGLWEGLGESGGLSLDVLDIRLTDGSEFEDRWYNLTRRGFGNVAVFQFDLASKALLEWEYCERAMEPVINDILSDKDGRQVLREFEYGAVSNMISNAYINDIPNISHYIIVLSAYIFLLPVIYLALKKKDKRHFIWAAIPVLSILFGVIIYITGTGSRLKNPNVNYLCVLTPNIHNTFETVYIGSTSPRNRAYGFSVDGEYSLFHMDAYGYYNYGTTPERPEARIIIKRGAAGNNISILRTSAFETNYFRAEGYDDSVGDIRARLEYSGSGHHLSVENNTGLALEDAGIVIPDYGVIAITRLNPGETAEFGENDIRQLGYDQNPASVIIPGDLQAGGLRVIRRNQLSAYSMFVDTGYNPYLIGYAGGHVPKIGDNPNIDMAGDTIVVKSVEVVSGENGIYIPNIRSCLIGHDGNYGDFPEYIYESEPLDATYQFFNAEIESLRIRDIENAAAVSFMNVETGEYERVFLNGGVLSEGLEAYMDEGRILRARYEVETGTGDYTAEIPVIAALGEPDGGS